VHDSILIVGGGRGIGAAIAAKWPERATVWTRTNGVDASDPKALRTAFAEFRKAHGAPFALVHCVGDFAEQPLLTTSEVTYRQMFESNVGTTFHVAQTVVPAMVEARRGRVLLFAAAGVDKERAMVRAPVYFAAKAALVQMGRALAAEVAAAGVTVNILAPGLITHGDSHHESQRRLLPRVPVGRLGTVDDVLGCVDYLLSADAAYVTGQVVTIDGGLQV
jgi:3-oxoacyl-[acyl-carrier protein] reductase